MISMSIVPKIVMINILVYLLWNFYGVMNPNFMINNFLVSWSALSEGRIWTLVTSAFSHNMFWHILINMMVFFNFGVVVENTLGPVRFLAFYLIAGIIGSLGHSLVCALILNQPNLPALGASGAVSGVVMLFALLYPQQKIFLFGIVPLPAIWAAVLFVALDGYGLFNQSKGMSIPIGHGAHLGGSLSGLIYYAILRAQGSISSH